VKIATDEPLLPWQPNRKVEHYLFTIADMFNILMLCWGF